MCRLSHLISGYYLGQLVSFIHSSYILEPYPSLTFHAQDFRLRVIETLKPPNHSKVVIHRVPVRHLVYDGKSSAKIS